MKIIKPQVVIPMSGIGKRFIEAGFYHLKPLIPIANSRIIYEVMSMFPGIDDPLFIISKDHKQKSDLVDYLMNNLPQYLTPIQALRELHLIFSYTLPNYDQEI